MGQEREDSQGFFEMLWDCDHCDARGLLGKSQRYCANCGAPQNPEKRYFPREGEEHRIDGHQYEGADRTCPACSAPQSAKAKNCTHCGAVLDGAAEVKGVVDAPAGPRIAAPHLADPRIGAWPRRRRRQRIWALVLPALLIVGFGIWWRCIRTEPAQVTVTGHTWKRAIAIEVFDERQEEAWRDEIPPDGMFPSCFEKERSTRQVQDGEECHTERRDRKDGTFEQIKVCKATYRSEPVMDLWCHFTTRRWKAEDEAVASGAGLTPEWPTNLPPTNPPPRLGARRQGKRTETFTLSFVGHGKCDVNEGVWRSYRDGQTITAAVHAGGDVACSKL